MPGSRATQLFRTKRLSGRPAAARPTAVLVGISALLLALPGWAASPQSEALAKARQLYNERQYAQAIETAGKALSAPAFADSARVVIGRAHLEQFRLASDRAELDAARNALRQVQTSTLAPRDRADYLIGLGESLYLDNQFGAASEIFSSAIGAATPREIRDSALDWWASCLDRVALQQPAEEREDIYYRIVERMEDELVSEPGSAPATYWLAAASRGASDLDRAWDAAVSGWVRALLSPSPATAAALRGDLDRLMDIAIIPERASAEATRSAERAGDYAKARDSALDKMQNEWKTIKNAWK